MQITIEVDLELYQDFIQATKMLNVKEEDAFKECMRQYVENARFPQKNMGVHNIAKIPNNFSDNVNNKMPSSNPLSESEKLLRDLRTVGLSTFVKYLEYFINYDTREIKQIMQEKEDWAYNSLNTKSSTGKGIIKKGLAQQALIIIANSNNTGTEIIKQAKMLLKEYFSEEYSSIENNFDKRKLETQQVYDILNINIDSDSTIRIKNYEFNLHFNPKKGEKNQDFVRRTLYDLLRNNLIPSDEILRLQNLEYSKKTFGLQYPLFQKEWQNCIDNTGKTRYWSGKFNGEFFVCSQWWKQNVVMYDRKFADWLMYLSEIVK